MSASAKPPEPTEGITITNLVPSVVRCDACGADVAMFEYHCCTPTRLEFEALKARLAQLLEAHGETL